MQNEPLFTAGAYQQNHHISMYHSGDVELIYLQQSSVFLLHSAHPSNPINHKHPV